MRGHTITTETAKRLAEMSNQLRHMRRRLRTRRRDRPDGGRRKSVCYAVRNSSDQAAASGNTEYTVTLDTQILRYPDDSSVFSLSGSLLTIYKAGVYRFSYVVPFSNSVTDYITQVWVEKNSVGIAGSLSGDDDPSNAVGIVSLHNSFLQVVTAGDEFRLRYLHTANNTTILSSAAYPSSLEARARLDIELVR